MSSLLLLLLALAPLGASSSTVAAVELAEFTGAVLLAPADDHPAFGPAAAAAMQHLRAHVARRHGTSEPWATEAGSSPAADPNRCAAAVIRCDDRLDQPQPPPGGYTLNVEEEPLDPAACGGGGANATRTTVRLSASDDAGFQAAIGRLARELRVWPGRVAVPRSLSVGGGGDAALWPLRGHQYTAAHHPSMFRSWAEVRARRCGCGCVVTGIGACVYACRRFTKGRLPRPL